MEMTFEQKGIRNLISIEAKILSSESHFCQLQIFQVSQDHGLDMKELERSASILEIG